MAGRIEELNRYIARWWAHECQETSKVAGYVTGWWSLRHRPLDIEPYHRGRGPDLRPTPRTNLSSWAVIVLYATSVALTLAWSRKYVILVLVAPLVATLVLYSRRDAVTVLGIFLTFLLFIPSHFAFAAYSAALTPALACGLLSFGIWVCFRMVPGMGLADGPQPVRALMLFLLWSGGASSAAAFMRPISTVESRAALVGLLVLVSSAGSALLAADGIQSQARLDALLRWLVVGASFVAVVGIDQFATGSDPLRSLSLPGLQVVGDSVTYIGERSSFRRIGGTTSHPIEFAVVLTMVLPLALHYARMPTARGRVQRWGWWACVASLLIAIPMAVSRSGVVGLAVGGLVTLLAWPWRHRLFALAGAVALALGIRFAVPGLLGTLVSLFTVLDSDPSVVHRTADYGTAIPYIASSPWFGRGFRTFIPNKSYDPLVGGYPYVDNQYLLSLIETGIVGLIALLAFFAVGIGLTLTARRLSTDAGARDLSHSLTASLLVAAVTFVTFNALAFPMVTGITFLLLGSAGALWRIRRDATKQAAMNVGASTEQIKAARLMPN